MRRTRDLDAKGNGGVRGGNEGGNAGTVGVMGRRECRSAGFVQRALELFEIEDGEREINESIDEGERALERLYHMLENDEETER